MTEKHFSLFSRNNFENEWFYYFLNLNYEKRHIIGERISEFQGVSYFYIINIKIDYKLFSKREHKYYHRK